MTTTVKTVAAKPTKKISVSLSANAKAKARRNTNIVNGAIMLNPNDPSDREFWKEDEADDTVNERG